jgi:hypothetical protein
VGQRVTQNASDNASLLPLVDEVMGQCRGKPQRVSADTGFFSWENLPGLKEREIDGYVPDANLSYELKGKGRAGKASICEIRSIAACGELTGSSRDQGAEDRGEQGEEPVSFMRMATATKSDVMALAQMTAPAWRSSP